MLNTIGRWVLAAAEGRRLQSPAMTASGVVISKQFCSMGSGPFEVSEVLGQFPLDTLAALADYASRPPHAASSSASAGPASDPEPHHEPIEP